MSRSCESDSSASICSKFLIGEKIKNEPREKQRRKRDRGRDRRSRLGDNICVFLALSGEGDLSPLFIGR